MEEQPETPTLILRLALLKWQMIRSSVKSAESCPNAETCLEADSAAYMPEVYKLSMVSMTKRSDELVN